MDRTHPSIVAIGTELTSGQIINRNASWISARLKKMGMQTHAHITVPDDRELIRRAFDEAAALSSMIFVTGGLGPTSDDFTREVISEWTGLELIWHEPSWTFIQERFRERGLLVQEMQKQQCYYPKGAEVLTNSQGTAHAFRIRTATGLTFISLPGPPREVEAVWTDHLESWIPTQFPGLDPWITRSWDTLGRGESAIAELTETALKDCPFEIGYRVHHPYVEVKLSYKKSQSLAAEKWIAAVTENLKPFTALRDGDEVTRLLALKLLSFEHVIVVDELAGGYLWDRLQPQASPLWGTRALTWSNRPLFANHEDLFLWVRPLGTLEAEAVLRHQGCEKRAHFQSPYASPILQERARQYFVEQACLFWTRELSAL